MTVGKWDLMCEQLCVLRKSLQSTFAERFAQILRVEWPYADCNSSAYDLAVRRAGIAMFEAAAAAWLEALFASVQVSQADVATLGGPVDAFAEEGLRALGRGAAQIAAKRARMPAPGVPPLDAVQAAEDRWVNTTLARLRLNRLGVPLQGTGAAMANITNTINVSGSGNTVLAGQHQSASVSQELQQKTVSQAEALIALEELSRIVIADLALKDRSRKEVLEVISDVRPQLESKTPNVTKLRGLVDALKAGCETVTAAGPAIQQVAQWLSGLNP